MKKTLMPVAIAAAFTLAANANAGSPKGDALADSLKKVPGTTPDMIDHSLKSGSPKAIALAESARMVPSAGPTVDLAHAPRPTMSPKDSRFDTAWRQNAQEQQVQIAPLK